MTDPDTKQRPTFIPGQGPGFRGGNEIPFGLTKTQFLVGFAIAFMLFFFAFGVAMMWQGE